VERHARALQPRLHPPAFPSFGIALTNRPPDRSEVRRAGDPSQLRQLYVERGMHCSFSAADEIVALRTLFERIDTGRWPDTSPRRLNEAARELGDGLQLVLDFGTFQDAPVPPAFTSFTPPEFLRPSR
jgi:hypothetical protein